MIETVFCDLDGVLVDFNGSATAIIGAENPPKKWRWYEDYEDGFRRVNDACTWQFWANLDWMHDGHDILRAVIDTFDPAQIYLLTTPMPNPGSASGKMEWIDRHLPTYNKKIFITTASKSVVARPDTLLIDDKDQNVEEFTDAGGEAILVPRPWNELHGWAGEAYQVVKNSLENFK